MLANDVSEISGIFPEYEHDNNLETKSDVGNQTDKSTKLIFVTSVFFIFVSCRAVNNEKLDKVINPGKSDQKHEATESLSCNCIRVIKNVKGKCCDSQAQETVSLKHLQENKYKEDVDNNFCYLEPGDGLGVDIVLGCRDFKVGIEFGCSLLFLFSILVVALLLFLCFLD